jgi:hypothetical protein
MKPFNIFLAFDVALIAAAIAAFFTSGQSLWAFVGWMVFFSAIVFPAMWAGDKNVRCFFTKNNSLKK